MAHATFDDWPRELAVTRRMLSRVPTEHFDWKPHPKSMTLGTLVAHLVNLLNWQLVTLTEDQFDFANPSSRAPIPSTTEESLQIFDDYAARVHEALGGIDASTLAKLWTLRNGDQVIFEQPKAAVFRTGISHIVHHRGQLSVYLRLLDVPVPPSYGPTADEGG